MLVSFLIQLDDSGGKKKAHSSSEGIQLEEKPNKESPGVEAKGPLDPPSDLHLLRLVLEEVKAAKRQNNGQDKDQRKPGCYRTLAKAIDRDEKLQTVTNYIWTQKRWKNELLTWNPSDFCGIDMLTMPLSKLWVPDVAIQEE
ncbi:unnamed protein product [Menidia menidia]|uniref:(Atlantic silverside) hypothetical protein n=1 Tax=Menidia menidia TaxID=238744 RepID=A0A8S4BB72_9TELE|nr:unnamed protein product [Menidia menidia]